MIPEVPEYTPTDAAKAFWTQAEANHEKRGPHSFPMDTLIAWEAVDLALASRDAIAGAAPDLLAALTDLLAQLAQVNEVARMSGWPDNVPRHAARVAIARAKGAA